MKDPVHDLAHDHAELNRRVLELGSLLAGVALAPRGNGAEPDDPDDATAAARHRLAVVLADLREQLFLHFAREEEGLFPFVSERIPELGDWVAAMATAHDAICGALARMVHLASAAAAGETAAATDEPAMLRGLYDRFQASYAEHARAEAELLHVLDGKLDAPARAQLAELVRDL